MEICIFKNGAYHNSLFIQFEVHMKFKVGDVAVYPGKGVGRIEAINKRQIPDLIMQ